MFDCSSFVNQGPVVQKPINLLQDYRKIWFHSGQLFAESFFCLILFLKIDFFYCKILPNISIEQHLGVER